METENYTCENCNGETEETVTVDGSDWCEPCAENAIQCDDCCELSARDCGDSNRTLCESCAEAYDECAHCNDLEHAYVHDENGNALCEYCYDRHYFTCDACGDVCSQDDYSQDGMCRHCAPECNPSGWEHQETDCREPKSATFNEIPARAFGIELEMLMTDADSAPFFQALPRWGSVDDGSLEFNGVEIVSPPLIGDEGLSQVQTACDMLHDCADVRVDNSCGFHLHIDARDLHWRAVRRFVKLWMRIQEWTKSTLPSSRRNGRKGCCNGGGGWFEADPAELDAISSELEMMAWVYDCQDLPAYSQESRVNHAKKCKYDSARYCQLNLHSWVYRGTLEIRAHSGTTNYEKISAWAQLWVRAVEFTRHATDYEIDCIVDGFDLLRVMGAEHLSGYFRSRIDKFAPSTQEV